MGTSWSFRRGRPAPTRTAAKPPFAALGPERFLEEAADGLALDAQADHAARPVDLVDRIGRNEPAAPRQKAGAHRERVGHVGRRAVHRALDLPDEPAAA